jgi:protein-disulfide isomerase
MQCTVESNLPTPVPENAARFASVSEKDWILGSPDAKVTLLEYSDFM